MFPNISYYFRFSENKEMKKVKDERTMLHKKAAKLFLKKERFRKENEKLKNKLRRFEKMLKEVTEED